jgi:VanZ family protein
LRLEGLRGAVLVGAALALGIAWAIVDEVHQSFVPARTGSWRDVLVDAVGLTAGVTLAARRAPRAAN